MTTQLDGHFAGTDHNHQRCVATALDAAEELCRRRGARLTAIRRQVLELVWQSHRPIGAYAVLEALQRDRDRSEAGDRRGPVAPPTVYRALEFLLEQRLIHRIESLNAYVGCAHPGARHAAQFLICNDCGSAAELESAPLLSAIDAAAANAGFGVERIAVEISGRCPDCREPAHGG